MNGLLLSDVGIEFAQAFLTSLGLGLLMGLERERNPASRAGLRTFGLVALLGTVCAALGQHTGATWLLAGGLVMVGAMMIAAYERQPDLNDPGTTSVVAVLLCFCYGAMVWYGWRTQATMLAILTTVLLYFKAELRSLSEKLTRRDLVSVLQFAVLSLVVLPILPDHDFGPYGTLNPRQIWWMVVLIAGVSLAGYAALRIAGQRHGAPLLGILGGMASSTATTLVFSRHASSNPGLTPLATVVVLIANLVVFIRLAIVTGIVQPGVLPTLLPALGGGLLGGLAFVLASWRQLRQQETAPELELRNPTELPTALTFGAVYAVILFLSAALSDYFGSAGLYTIAVISGLTDVDAITLSSLRLFGLGKLTMAAAALSILLALLANLVFKFGVVLSVAGKGMALRIAAGFAAMAGGSLGGWWLAM